MPPTVSTPPLTSPAAPSLFASGEKLFSPAAIAKHIPSHRDQAHLNGSTVFRWIVRGVKTASGEVIKLEAVRLGYYWRTSLEAVERFTALLTAAAVPADPTSPPTPPAPTPKIRQRAAANATKQLDQLLS